MRADGHHIYTYMQILMQLNKCEVNSILTNFPVYLGLLDCVTTHRSITIRQIVVYRSIHIYGPQEILSAGAEPHPHFQVMGTLYGQLKYACISFLQSSNIGIARLTCKTWERRLLYLLFFLPFPFKPFPFFLLFLLFLYPFIQIFHNEKITLHT